MSKHKYLIIGAGASGGTVGGLLLKCGVNVGFVARSAYEEMLTCGLELSSGDGVVSHHSPEKLYPSLDNVPETASFDVFIIAVKTYNNQLVFFKLKKFVQPDSVVILLQNGINIEAEAAKHLGCRVIAVTAWVKATRLDVATYRHDFGTQIYCAEYKGDHQYSIALDENLNGIITDFSKSGLNLDFNEHFLMHRWTKLALNLPFEALTIIYNKTSDQILTDEHLRKQANSGCKEVERVALSQGSNIDREIIDSMYAKLALSPTRPSMKVDFDEHKPLELDSSYGNVIAMASAAGVATPLLLSWYKQLAQMVVDSGNPV